MTAEFMGPGPTLTSHYDSIFPERDIEPLENMSITLVFENADIGFDSFLDLNGIPEWSVDAEMLYAKWRRWFR